MFAMCRVTDHLLVYPEVLSFHFRSVNEDCYSFSSVAIATYSRCLETLFGWHNGVRDVSWSYTSRVRNEKSKRERKRIGVQYAYTYVYPHDAYPPPFGGRTYSALWTRSLVKP